MSTLTVLVTGGAGFIGSNFVHFLLRELRDVQVIVYDKLTYAGNIDNLARDRHDPRLSFVQGDIVAAHQVREVMANCNWVVNFAAETHVDRSISQPKSFVTTDVEGTFTLLEAAREYHIERFIQISTDEVYGNAEAPDGTSRPSLETDALKPLSPYAASKAGADRLAFSYWSTYGLPVTVTRCSNNYGPYQYPEKQLPLFICNALQGRSIPIYGDGKNTRDWIHVEDHCSALLALLQAPLERVQGEVFNIGAEEERSVLQNALAILALLALPEDLITFVADRPGHVQRHAVNSEKLRTAVPWSAKHQFVDGLRETVAWYREHPEWIHNVLQKQDAFLQQAMVAGAHPSHS